MSGTFDVKIAALTDTGSVREKNDDRVTDGTNTYGEGLHSCVKSEPVMLAVCDGVGGYLGGNVAAETALNTLSRISPEELENISTLAGQLKAANEEILKIKGDDTESNRMLTTVAGVVLGEKGTLIFHAGDSRVYRLRGSILRQLTLDHSPAQEYLMGSAEVEDPEGFLAANSRISRFLGKKAGCEPPEVEELPKPMDGDLYLICSDGLWSVFRSFELEEELQDHEDLDALAQRLFDEAIRRGSDDNVSICLIKVIYPEGASAKELENKEEEEDDGWGWSGEDEEDEESRTEEKEETASDQTEAEGSPDEIRTEDEASAEKAFQESENAGSGGMTGEDEKTETPDEAALQEEQRRAAEVQRRLREMHDPEEENGIQ